MERNTVLTGVSLLIIGLAVGYAISDRKPQAAAHLMENGSMMSQGIDQHFITQMVPHHEGAIAMAKVALERSERSEIRSLAGDIIGAQKKEITDMRAWHDSWFGSFPSNGGMGGMHMQGMEGDLDVLRSVPEAEFDREFIDQMIPHHEMAIMMAQMLQASTDRAEMKELAENIIASQSQEIATMREWRAEWYGQ